MANIISAVWRHKVISMMLIVAVAAGTYYFWPRGANTGATIYTYGTAQLGNIVQSVSGTGQVSTTDQVDVKSKVAGTVTAVKAKTGQAVKKGDVLVLLDSAGAQADYDTAKANLESARLTLQKSQQDNSMSLEQAKNAVTNAENQLEQAQDDLSKTYEQAFNSVTATFGDLPTIMAGMDDILNGSNSVVIQNDSSYFSYYQRAITSAGGSTANLLSVGSTYSAARSSYDNVFSEYKKVSRYSDQATISKIVDDSYDAAKKISNAAKAMISLIQQYRDAVVANNGTPQAFSTTHLSSLNTYLNDSNSDLVSLMSTQQALKSAAQSVTSARQSLEQQKQSLETLQNLTNPISAKTQQQSVIQKETALSDAAETLGYYTVRAPFDGVATAVNVAEGDDLAANATIATVITDQQIAKISLNEVDVASVKPDQKVTLTFDAVSDLTLTGHVSEVDAVGTVSSGVVSYQVTILFDMADDRIKPGMSVTAAIVTNIKQDTLLVPATAVKSSAAGNYVLLPVMPVVEGVASGSSAEGQTVRQQAVTVGISDDANTEITGGLNEGDTVVVKTATAKAASASSSSGSIFNLFGGPQQRNSTTRTSGSSSSSSGSSRTSGSAASSSSNSNTPTPPVDMGPGMHND